MTSPARPADNPPIRPKARSPLEELRRQQEGLQRLLERIEVVIKRPAQAAPDGELNRH